MGHVVAAILNRGSRGVVATWVTLLDDDDVIKHLVSLGITCKKMILLTSFISPSI